MTTLVTGAAGFTGRHLVAVLQREGFNPVGVDLDVPGGGDNEVHALDLGNVSEVATWIHAVRPTHVIHLAGKRQSRHPSDLYRANVVTTVNLLDALLHSVPDCTVLNIGSSAQYGRPADPTEPLTEDDAERPLSDYGASKLAQEIAVMRYYRSTGLPVMATRTFNLIGPGQPDTLACSAFARQVAEIEAGLRAPLVKTGPLDTRRDFVDVRDVARAYAMLVRSGKAGEIYNVCSGVATRVGDCLEVLRGLSTVPFRIETEQSAKGNEEIAIQYGNAERLAADTAWHPTISIEQSLSDLLDGWRANIGKAGSDRRTLD